MNSAELSINSKSRENCFRLLSACFYEPQKKLLIEEDLFGNLTAGLQQVCPEAAAFSVNMEDGIHNCTEEEIRIDYAKLFVGPFELLAPPYGSVYLDEGRRVMGDTTMEVIDIYEKEGLASSDDFNDLPDHIAVELEFMSYLIYKERKAVENSDPETAEAYAQKQEHFLYCYMLPWIPDFCCKIKSGAENGFYRALADCTSSFISRMSADNRLKIQS